MNVRKGAYLAAHSIWMEQQMLPNERGRAKHPRPWAFVWQLALSCLRKEACNHLLLGRRSEPGLGELLARALGGSRCSSLAAASFLQWLATQLDQTMPCQ